MLLSATLFYIFVYCLDCSAYFICILVPLDNHSTKLLTNYRVSFPPEITSSRYNAYKTNYKSGIKAPKNNSSDNLINTSPYGVNGYDSKEALVAEYKLKNRYRNFRSGSYPQLKSVLTNDISKQPLSIRSDCRSLDISKWYVGKVIPNAKTKPLLNTLTNFAPVSNKDPKQNHINEFNYKEFQLAEIESRIPLKNETNESQGSYTFISIWPVSRQSFLPKISKSTYAAFAFPLTFVVSQTPQKTASKAANSAIPEFTLPQQHGNSISQIDKNVETFTTGTVLKIPESSGSRHVLDIITSNSIIDLVPLDTTFEKHYNDKSPTFTPNIDFKESEHDSSLLLSQKRTSDQTNSTPSFANTRENNKSKIDVNNPISNTVNKEVHRRSRRRSKRQADDEPPEDYEFNFIQPPVSQLSPDSEDGQVGSRKSSPPHSVVAKLTNEDKQPPAYRYRGEIDDKSNLDNELDSKSRRTGQTTNSRSSARNAPRAAPLHSNSTGLSQYGVQAAGGLSPQQLQLDRRTQIRYPSQPARPLPTNIGQSVAAQVPIIGPVSSSIHNMEPSRPAPNNRALPPTLRAPFDQLDVVAGKFFRSDIPHDTFFDYTDGSTPNLRLVLYNIDKVPVESDKRYNWIRLDEKNMQIYGLPTQNDIGLHELILAAYNKRNIPVHNAFTVLVQNRPKGFRSADEAGINHRFWVVLQEPTVGKTEGIRRPPGKRTPTTKIIVTRNNGTSYNGSSPPLGAFYKDFSQSLNSQLGFFDRLLRYYFGLPAPVKSGGQSRKFEQSTLNKTLIDQIFLDSFASGSVRVNWVNDSLLTPPKLSIQAMSDYIKEKGFNYTNLMGCPRQDINAIASHFVQNPEDSYETQNSQLNPDFEHAMAPDYQVTSAGYDLLHHCSPAYLTAPGPVQKKVGVAPVGRSPNYERDLWLTTIIPALVMAFLMLLAGLIACCLYRRSVKPRFATQEDRALFKKGIPVMIYPEEYGDNVANLPAPPSGTELLSPGPVIANTSNIIQSNNEIHQFKNTPQKHNINVSPQNFQQQPSYSNQNGNQPQQLQHHQHYTSNPYQPLLQQSVSDHMRTLDASYKA